MKTRTSPFRLALAILPIMLFAFNVPAGSVKVVFAQRQCGAKPGTCTPTPNPTNTYTPIPTTTHTPVPTQTNTSVPTATNTSFPSVTPLPTHTPTETPDFGATSSVINTATAEARGTAQAQAQQTVNAINTAIANAQGTQRANMISTATEIAVRATATAVWEKKRTKDKERNDARSDAVAAAQAAQTAQVVPAGLASTINKRRPSGMPHTGGGSDLSDDRFVLTILGILLAFMLIVVLFWPENRNRIG